MDRSDENHARATVFLDTIAEILLPAPTLVELDWLGSSRRVPVTDSVLKGIAEGSIRVAALAGADYVRVRELCAEYADLPLGLVDASVVAIAERLQHDTVATFDRRHFSVVRPRHTPSFTLVP